MASPLGAWWRSRRDLASLRGWNEVDQRRLAFYAKFVRPAETAFDIGANVGNRTKIFRRIGARVIALEPQPYCQGVLRRAFAGDQGVIVVPAAVGSKEGTAEMKIASGHVVSSLSPEWIGEVSRSGRFGDVSWDRSITCRITTVDRLIADYGVPAFVKIDVEGYELQVIEGMTSAVGALSFEFTPECRANALACIERLDTLGMVEFNYSSGESMAFDTGWSGKADIRAALDQITDTRSFGDVYARTPVV